MINEENIITSLVIDRLIEIGKQSEAGKWLENLPRYECPFCKKETIFKDGCVDCEEQEYGME
jgi:hypothetical protein